MKQRFKGRDVGTPFAGARVAEAVPLAPLTTLRVGPTARRVITCTSTEQIVTTLRQLDAERPEQVLVLAGGSNLVISDTVTELTVVRLASDGLTIDGDILRVEAGAVWDDVVAAAIEHGLGGLECLSGIPGSAGATPVQNVGAYGAEVSDTITRVRLLDRRSGAVGWVPAAELRFGYRTSALKGADAPPAVVLEVEFALDRSGRSAPLRYGELTTALGVASGERVDPAAVREAVLRLRRRKGMVLDADDHDTWSVGSFFTNPVVTDELYRRLADRVDGPVPHFPAPEGVKLAAAWLVERAGFRKGYPGSDTAACRLSTKHALALTNRGDATTADVLALARTVRDGVRDVFGITLTPEPVLVGCVL
jgi:UDP-N-acetylmuramate dehydrogenase